jgi:ABC-type polar amino acid transport system ATPase subunit
MNHIEDALIIARRYAAWLHSSATIRITAVEQVGEAGPYRVCAVQMSLGDKVVSVVGEIGPGTSWFVAYLDALHAALYQGQLRLEKRQRQIEEQEKLRTKKSTIGA